MCRFGTAALAALVAMVVAAVVASPALASAPCGSGGVFSLVGTTGTCSYATVGTDTFAVPSGVSSVAVTAVGGAGGACSVGGSRGASVTAGSLVVTAGAMLHTNVAGVGGSCFTAGGGSGGGGIGGPGGNGGGGGGGASWLSGSSGFVQADMLVVAGGGGGVGGAPGPGGGGGGGDAGAAGTTAAPADPFGGGGGGGGGATSSAGGAGGAGAPTTPPGETSLECSFTPAGPAGAGESGSAGQGGDGGFGAPPGLGWGGGDGGGGGGGGYYGGGGGGGGSRGGVPCGGGGGGGGGSSFVAQGTLTATPTSAPASLAISWTLPAPNATITAPADGATYTPDQMVNASYSCADDPNGPGIQSCTGTVADGAPIDTTSGGAHSFSVTATSSDGQSSTATVNYTVAKAVPALTTNASAGVVLGGSVHDTATLSGGSSPGGQITFNLYGPDDANCSGTPAFTDTKAVSGNGSYQSAAFTPTQAGVYRWVASYGGDSKNGSAAGACNASGESVTVSAPPHPPTDPDPPSTDPDSDGDGIPDASDQCPAQSGPASNNGCLVQPPAPPDTAACDKAKAKLAKAKAKLKKLTQHDAPKAAIDNAKHKVKKAKSAVKAACAT